jgi:predicted ATPase
VAVIDELDAAIHPLLLPEILRWFYDRERNPHDAQLWMSCHNASLLEELIKEEVFFCAKDRGGRTEIYGLKDIQAVRRTDNYYRKYLGGMFGAVPQIG